VCDAAEVTWGELADRQDMLRLLAGLCQGFGASGLMEYTPPSEQLAELLRPEDEPVAGDPEARRAEVVRLMNAVGGEVS